VLVVTVVIAAGLSLCDDGTDEADEVCTDTKKNKKQNIYILIIYVIL